MECWPGKNGEFWIWPVDGAGNGHVIFRNGGHERYVWRESRGDTTEVRKSQSSRNNKTLSTVWRGFILKFGSRRVALPDFKIDMSLPAFDFYEVLI